MSLTVGGLTASLAAFGVASLVIVLLMLGLAVAIGLAQDELVARIRAHTQQVKRLSGGILIVVGLWTLAIGIWAESFAQIFPV